MGYLDKYDALTSDRERAGTVEHWIRTEPRPLFAELRTDRPVFATPLYTLVTRHPDVVDVLARPDVFSVHLYAEKIEPVIDGPFMLASESEQTRAEKAVMQQVLRPADLPDVRRLAGRLADEALEAAARRGRVEVVSELGRYVPMRLCGDYFGFPGPDLPTMYRWSRATQVDIFKNPLDAPAPHAASIQAGREMRSYLTDLMLRKRAEPGWPDDVFSRLLREAPEAGLYDSRILANLVGLLVGAGETISQAVVQTLEQLLSRPNVREDAADAARAEDPAAFDGYVWEALRMNPINPVLLRVCEHDDLLAPGTDCETPVTAGTKVLACTSSAMFDADVVPDPDTFDPARQDQQRLHFGSGEHACLGRHLAAAIVPEVVRRVLLRSDARLGADSAVDFQQGPFPERFVVELGRAPAALPRTGPRSTAKDGLVNRVEFALTTNLAPVWSFAQQVRPLARLVNRTLVNQAAQRMAPRPNPLSTMAPYTSWASLRDRTFDSRHLPPVVGNGLPDVQRTADLFTRDGDGEECPKSTMLFAYFAQWFTDGFLRSDRTEPRDVRKNTSTHEIDLCQLYGLTEEVTRVLRTGRGGRLRSQVLGGQELPPYLCENGEVKPEFAGLPTVFGFERLDANQRAGLFAMGLDRANTQIGYAMLTVVFLREHNRVAALLADDHPDWDDERLFQTTRNVLTVLLLNVVIDEYINHITPYHFQFFLDAGAFPNVRWYRPNWMATEFNLLYRWHSLVPSTLSVGGRRLPMEQTLYNNQLIVDNGVGTLLAEASTQPSGRITLLNTAPALRGPEVQSLSQARDVGLASYNDYREYCGFPRATTFDQVTGDVRVQHRLRELYGTVDRVEFYVGLFAEQTRPNSVLPPLLGRMVGVDAFSQAWTNPLLSPRVFNAGTFSARGMRIIEQTRSLAHLVARNDTTVLKTPLTMTRTQWRRTG